ncbi:MAG: 5-amino-6-(D-ribitylamino)uracil--L-tyrosine 4-hydroxyphenyl transferase CofH [Parvibaculaceae bacterium]
MDRAGSRRDAGFGRRITYSRKVFIPLTHLCRDHCHYCTFSRKSGRGGKVFMSLDDVLDVVRRGEAAGCTEALFTLGDKPELRYRSAAAELADLGFATTIDYLHSICTAVLEKSALLPHLNPGVLTPRDYRLLRPVSASMGLMLESVSERLGDRGHAHFGSPDKKPAVRLECIRNAGEAAVPFTTGLLIGIGETRLERVQSLLALRELHLAHGHIQEIIVQPFRAKAGTRMASAPNASDDDLLWTIAVARIIFGPEMSIQTPPNLAPGLIADVVQAGINDWGGISPVTADHVNPEAPWPHIDALSEAMDALGKTLVQRLPVYPRFARDPERWLASEIRPAIARASDAEFYARDSLWIAGQPDGARHPPLRRSARPASAPLGDIIGQAAAGIPLQRTDIIRLFEARGPDFDAVCAAADELRARTSGDVVRYVVNRNINYTNMCTYKCAFCAFSKGQRVSGRESAYDLSGEEIGRRVREAWRRGATEVCMQGGIHPGYTGRTYLTILQSAKRTCPEMHIHAFSPLEVTQGARTLSLPVVDYLKDLKMAGLGSLPGTAAEILDDGVRAVICPDKLSSAEWLSTVEAAHDIGLKTTATIMFGHVDGPDHWATHLIRIRDLQKRSGGFTEFVPLPFVHMEAPMYFKGRARRGPTWREAVLMHAVSRLVLNDHIPNIQVSWVKMGIAGAQACLQAGANDLGGTLMNESISRAAGARHGQELPPSSMDEAIISAGRVPRQRTTLYATPPADRTAASYDAGPLLPVVQTPGGRAVCDKQLASEHNGTFQ